MDAQDIPPASSPVSSGEERREYFRVDDTLPLDYEPVSREEAERRKEDIIKYLFNVQRNIITKKTGAGL